MNKSTCKVRRIILFARLGELGFGLVLGSYDLVWGADFLENLTMASFNREWLVLGRSPSLAWSTRTN